MIAVDTNLLVYAHRKDSEWHAPAARWLGALAGGGAPWAIPWPCFHEFFAIVTHPRIYGPPSTAAQAIDQIEAWLESPNLSPLAEGASYWGVLRTLLEKGRASGPRVHDARVAALCLQHRVKELWTADRDFSRFSALSTRNPLVD